MKKASESFARGEELFELLSAVVNWKKKENEQVEIEAAIFAVMNKKTEIEINHVLLIQYGWFIFYVI